MNTKKLAQLTIAIRTIVCSAILASIVGCGSSLRNATGTHVGDLAGGSTHYKAHYGIRNNEIGFLIMTDISSEENMTSSSWNGYVKTKRGKEIQYGPTAGGILINGMTHSFENGRGFLVTRKGEKLLIHQIRVPSGTFRVSTDMVLLEKHPEVRAFFKHRPVEAVVPAKPSEVTE